MGYAAYLGTNEGGHDHGLGGNLWHDVEGHLKDDGNDRHWTFYI
jgi:hypothetical protein